MGHGVDKVDGDVDSVGPAKEAMTSLLLLDPVVLTSGHQEASK